MSNYFPFRPEKTPSIYAYSDKQYPGLLKIGYTAGDVERRVKEQYPVIRPDISYSIVFDKSAMRNDGTQFTDHDIHRVLRANGFENPNGEWYKCSLNDLEAAYLAVQMRIKNIENRTQNFGLRPEQEAAIEKTYKYFKRVKQNEPDRVPHFLWNAKMRFGKTFTTYQLAKRMGFKKVLVLTYKPAVEDSWKEDLMHHVDFENWQFISPTTIKFDECDLERPFVCFGSFQDYLGKNAQGGIKSKNEWVHSIDWDMVVIDEYHFGAWNQNAQGLIGTNSDDADIAKEYKDILKEDGFLSDFTDVIDESTLPITGNHYLYLSGTPFRAIASGEFIEEQIYNWTYADEQQAKQSYGNSEDDNPYLELPQMILLTYQLPSKLYEMIDKYGQDEFDLNEFFFAEGKKEKAKFTHENAVQKWLDIIRGSEPINSVYSPDNTTPPLPFSDTRLLNTCNHTMWFLPNVSSCDAMENILKTRHNNFFHNYTIINASGNSVGVGMEALPPVKAAMTDNPLSSKTIILTCGKLTTGVTIKPLSGILMLRNSSSPETYFQAAFRVQSSWTIKDEKTNKKIILKEKCYIFDFAPNRALNQIVEYSNKLNIDSNATSTQKVSEFINFLPVLAYDGSSMKPVDASEILDIVASGTSATLLARKWNSALLVNVDNATLSRLLSNPAAISAIMKIEGFRSLGNDIIKKIVNKNEKIKKLKKTEELTKKQKKELTDAEKEYKSMRKQVQEKLVKFATRIPIFMYLTDYREESLVDIIRKIAPKMFNLVTGLTIEDFELLVSLNVFNSEKMNMAILQFRRYEDASLEYVGIRKSKSVRIGLYDTVLPIEEFNGL